MIDPVQVFKAKASVGPIPSVVPDIPTYEEADQPGMTTLWVVFVIMLLSSLAFIGMAWRVPVQKRLFYILTTFITIFATLSYFAMATGGGNSFVHIVEKKTYKHGVEIHEDVFRQIFWARYIDWSITTPLLLLDLAFLAGVNGADIIVAIVADVIMILTRLFATYGHNPTQKWGWYAMGCVAYLAVVWILAVEGRRAAAAKSAKTATFFAAIGGFTLIVWTLYLVVWGLGEGSRILSVDSEIMAYAVLDLLAMPVFGFWLLISYARSGATSVSGWWSHGLATEGALRLNDDEGA